MAIRHSITLSTSEPNNEVGNLKIRQGDEQTQTLVVNITENGVPMSFVGYQPFFCAKLGQTAGLGIVEQKITGTMNPANGTLEYVMRPEDWQKVGRQIGYFAFRKMKNDHEWTEQFTTRDFSYNVIPSVTGEIREVKKDGSTYIWTIEDMLRSFKEYIATGKTDWEEFVEQNREILESVDPGGKLIGELIDARRPFGSEAYQTLGERLDDNDEQIKNVEIRMIKTMKSNFLKQQGLLIAHRGLMNLAPENSAIAFELAGKYGFWGIETDCHETVDGEFYLYHDADLSSQTNKIGKVYEMSSEELKDVVYTKAKGSTNYPNTPLCTLDEYLSIASKYNMFCILEIGVVKNHQGILDKIREYNMEGNVLINTNEYLVKAYRALDSFIPIGWVTWKKITDADINFCVENKVDMLGIAISDGSVSSNMNRDLVNKCHENGLIVSMYIVNKYSDYNWCKNNFVDVITTDHIIGGK